MATDLPTGPNARVFPSVGPALFEAVRAAGARRILLQVPAGLVRNAHDLAGEIAQASGARVSVSVRPCFGACDLPSAAEAGPSDLVISLGHAPIPNVRLERTTFFVEMRDPRGDPDRLAGIVADGGLPRRLGLVFSVQHLDLAGVLPAALERRGYAGVIGTGDRRLAYPGQALGCNYTSAESIADRVEAFLFLGTGRFHPLGLAWATDRPVWALDPAQGRLEPPIDRAALVAQRQLLVASVRDARRWGILVSGFAGQDRSATARALEERAKAKGHSATILRFDRLDPRDLEGRDLDAYVSTACPRIALDDRALYGRPLLTPPEFLMALGELPLAPYRFDTYH